MTVVRAKHNIHGGLHLPENKSPASEQAIRDCETAERLIMPLQMQSGLQSMPMVSVGDRLIKGQPIAAADGSVSATLHSPASGEVVAIEPRPMATRSGLEEPAIVIQTDVQDSSTKPQTLPWPKALSMSPKAILAAIEAAGIVGMGGAGFPTAIKIQASSNAKTLLINAAECEPYICCDDRTLREYSVEVLAGAFMIARANNCTAIQIGIEDNKPEAISAMESAIVKLPDHMQRMVKVIICDTIYPTGGERQLIEIITGKQVPSGTYPAEIGYLVQNVGTALAVHDKLTSDQPLTHRIVTVTGKAVRQPGNYRVPIGTPIGHLLDQAGLDASQCRTIIHGGPMMGFPVIDTNSPISKITNCIIAATEDELPELPQQQPCIRCGTCAEVCPVHLLPQQLFWFARAEEFDKAQDFKLFDCIECGLCAYVCPSHIPLVDYYRFAKTEIRNLKAAKIKSERSKVKFDARNERLEKERLEKERIKAEKAKQRAKKTSADADKKAAVAAALARVKAKKQVKEESNQQTSEDPKQ